MIFRSILAIAALTLTSLTVANAASSSQTLTIKMTALNNSGENGTATLTQKSNGVLVVVRLTHASGTQPTHIHIGTCGAISKAPEYALENTVNGNGASTVTGVKLSDLMKGQYAINVHKSADDLGTYVACGNIK